jgi:quercetin dioxygenase-like cupin family protein
MKRNQPWFPLLFVALTLCLPAPARAQGPEAAPVARNMADLKLAIVPGMPACFKGAVESGNPATGPGIILAKMTKGCKIPWHWHTAGTSLTVVNGKGRMEVTNLKSEILKAGGFARLPPRHASQFECAKACTVFIHTDAAFDIHYIGLRGAELPPEQALRAAGEVPAS